MNVGKVVQIIGPVVDVQFMDENLPAIYNAVRITSEGFDVPVPMDVTAEVEQHLGGGRVRCVGERPAEGNDLWREMKESGVIGKTALVYGQMTEPPGARLRVGLTGLTEAEYFRDFEGQDVLLFIDNIFRFTQAGSEG